MVLNTLNQLWADHGDAFITQFPITSDPTAYIILLSSVYALIYLVAPYFSYRMRSVDLRPVILILNGYMCGVMGMGFLIGFFLTGFGRDAFFCPTYNNFSYTTDMRLLGLKMIAYMYCVVKLKEFHRPLLASLAGKKNSRYLAPSYMIFLGTQLTIAYLGSVFYPGGVFSYWPLIDAIVTIADYSYLVLRSASKDLRPSESWGRGIVLFRFISIFTMMLHGLYFLTCQTCGHRALLKIQTTYCTIIVLYNIWSYITSSTNKSSSSCHAKLIVQQKNGSRNGRLCDSKGKVTGDMNNNLKQG